MPGPAPRSTCTVCNAPAVVLIDKALKDGMSDRKVAGLFGFKYPGVIQRHRKNHLALQPGGRPTSPPEEREPEPEPAGDALDPRSRLERVIRTLEARADEDARPEVFRELRLALEATAKMGSAEPPPVVRVRDVEGLPEMIRDMHEALKPWPDAREALAAVWRRHAGLLADEAAGDGG